MKNSSSKFKKIKVFSQDFSLPLSYQVECYVSYFQSAKKSKPDLEIGDLIFAESQQIENKLQNSIFEKIFFFSESCFN
tara:strand:- start:57 stop:290 length:234 start_codon:yes stop_codon:yes gene_type:complete